jgi:hypothetical protein
MNILSTPISQDVNAKERCIYLLILILKHLENYSKQREFATQYSRLVQELLRYAVHRAFLAKARLEAALPADKQCLLILNQIEFNTTTSLNPRTIYLVVFPGDQLIQQHHDAVVDAKMLRKLVAKLGLAWDFGLKGTDAEGTSTSASAAKHARKLCGVHRLNSLPFDMLIYH